MISRGASISAPSSKGIFAEVGPLWQLIADLSDRTFLLGWTTQKCLSGLRVAAYQHHLPHRGGLISAIGYRPAQYAATCLGCA
jgi:hypothetical protein